MNVKYVSSPACLQCTLYLHPPLPLYTMITSLEFYKSIQLYVSPLREGKNLIKPENVGLIIYLGLNINTVSTSNVYIYIREYIVSWTS